MNKKNRKLAPKLMRAKIDTGDYVKHIPTKEKWVVACVVGERLSWVGFPEGTANLEDCKLIRKANAARRMEVLHMLAKMEDQNDHRAQYSRMVLEKKTRK